MTSARDHGEMALEMLRVEESALGKEMDKLVDWLAADPPEVLCLSNALQIGMIRELKKRLDGVKVICFFQGEDTFVDGLPEPYRESCWREMTERLPEADAAGRAEPILCGADAGAARACRTWRSRCCRTGSTWRDTGRQRSTTGRR